MGVCEGSNHEGHWRRCRFEYVNSFFSKSYAVTEATIEDSADVWLTVPAAWDAKGCDIMREAAITAGLVQSSKAGDTTWRERLRIITEPEAAAVHCARLTDLHHLKPSQNFIVADAGGGTVDLAVYKVSKLSTLILQRKWTYFFVLVCLQMDRSLVKWQT